MGAGCNASKLSCEIKYAARLIVAHLHIHAFTSPPDDLRCADLYAGSQTREALQTESEVLPIARLFHSKCARLKADICDDRDMIYSVEYNVDLFALAYFYITDIIAPRAQMLDRACKMLDTLKAMYPASRARSLEMRDEVLHSIPMLFASVLRRITEELSVGLNSEAIFLLPAIESEHAKKDNITTSFITTSLRTYMTALDSLNTELCTIPDDKSDLEACLSLLTEFKRSIASSARDGAAAGAGESAGAGAGAGVGGVAAGAAAGAGPGTGADQGSSHVRTLLLSKADAVVNPSLPKM